MTKADAVNSRKPNVVAIDSGTHRERFEARRNALVEQHLSLVDAIAWGICQRLPGSFQFDDLKQIGYMALLKAATRFRPNEYRHVPFGAFARPIIRGAILDSFTGSKWLEATQPGIESIAEPRTEPAAVEAIDRKRTTSRIINELDYLTEQEKRVICLYYAGGPRHQVERQTFSRVAQTMRLSEGRVSQIHQAALTKLRKAEFRELLRAVAA